ncbi:MAG: T9SS type A sorting domain-containing protein [Chitinophagales bacterium]
MYEADEADEADYKAVIPLYLQKGDIANAQQYLNLISAHNAENTQYIALQNLHINLQSTGRSWYDINAQEEATIRSIATSPTRVAVHAQAILHWVFGEQFETHIPDIDGSGSHKRTILPPFSNRISKQELQILPNPSKGIANVYWTPQEVEQPAQIQIFDLTGREVASYAVDAATGQTQLFVEGLKNGIYICVLKIGEEITYQTKWVVVK